MSFVVSRGGLSWWPGPSFRARRGRDFVVGLGLGLGLGLGVILGVTFGGFRRRREVAFVVLGGCSEHKITAESSQAQKKHQIH